MTANSVMVPVPLRAARELGLKWYFTGLPCPHGHIAKRSVANRECRHCVAARDAKQRVESPERLRANDKRRYWKDPIRARAATQASRALHVEKRRAYDHDRYHNNPARKEDVRRRARAWWKRDATTRGKFAYRVARARARIKQATPLWLSAEQHREIRAFYIRAALVNQGRGLLHVDHIFPIRGKDFRGLNVPWNLQLLPAQHNREKRNGHPFA